MTEHTDSMPPAGDVRPAEDKRSGAMVSNPARVGKVRPAVLLWALGVPIPIILIILLVRSCMT